MKKTYLILLVLKLIALGIYAQSTLSISKDKLQDKIKGGWAGQTIGVTYGAPVEFHYNGTLINDYHRLEWNDELMKKSMLNAPGIYDDLYMDLTFVEVFDKEGLDAPVASHAKAFAHAGYALWHANQAARYNILNDITPPASGYWKNNPHADCIDYQIESDFAGLMSPAMPNTASEISDKIGHIMNYGDGWYGGVFVGAMYSLAFTSNNISHVIDEALKTIPVNTTYHACIADVIKWHKQYPNDWKQTWFEIQKKWTNDIGCPEGVYTPFNIDAKINSAYVVLGLLYGNGDFSKTLEITTRCGQDADCNPSTAGGILGTIMGYKALPSYWSKGLKLIEDINFKYTSTSLNKVYEIGTRQAIENIVRHGGKIQGENIIIQSQQPLAVKLEQSFPNLIPAEKRWIGVEMKDKVDMEFIGTGFALRGEARIKPSIATTTAAVLEMEAYVDGKKIDTFKMPVDFTTRKHEVCWNYDLHPGKHTLSIKVLNPNETMYCLVTDLITYQSNTK